MRLIDADAAGKQVNIAMVRTGNRLMCISEIKDFLEAQPTVEERQHGHWVQVSDWDKDGNAHFDCSVCGYGDKHGDDVVVPYCWHCGAKMDGEVNE